MRTTVTLEADLAERLKDYAHRSRVSFKVALNTLLRRGLMAQEPATTTRRRFVVQPHSGGFKPGVDVGKLNQLVDQLEVDGFVRKQRSRR